SQQTEQQGQAFHAVTTFSRLASHSIVFFWRYDSTAILIATIVEQPRSALQASLSLPRSTSMKLPSRSRRCLIGRRISSLPSFFALNSSLKSPLKRSDGSPPSSIVP